MGRKILVTGGSGFIGGHIVRELAARGDNVINFDACAPGPKIAWLQKSVAENIEFVQGSIDNWAHVIETIKTYKPEIIIHAAAITDLDYLRNRPECVIGVNFGGTVNVLEAARIFQVGRVVFISSCTVIPMPVYEPVDQNHPVLLARKGTAIHFYSASKVASEAFCWAYHQSFNLDVLIIRPVAIYGLGRGDALALKVMVENSVRGIPVHIEKSYPYAADTHVTDVAQLVMKTVDIHPDQVKDRVFFAASGRSPIAVEVAAEIVRSLISDAQIVVNTTKFDAQVLGNQPLQQKGFSIQNAKEQLAFEPKFADLREGVADYIETSRRYFAETGDSLIQSP